MQLYDKTGQPVDVPDDKVGDAFASGNFGLPAGQAVPVRLRSGAVGTVPSEHLEDAFAKGASIATPHELEHAEAEREYGGLGGQLETAVAGGLHGATIGLSDVAATAIGGEDTAKALRRMKEANPYTYGASELAGAVAPLLGSGGASAAVEGGEAASALARAGEAGGTALRGIGIPTCAASGLGGLAERGAASLVGEGATSLAGRVAQKAAPMAARTGVEGAIYSGGDELSRQALEDPTEHDLGDPESNGQKLMAAVGHGFLLGSAGGALLGGTGEIGREVLGRAAPHIAGAAEEQAWKTISGRKAFQTEAEKIPGGDRAIGRLLLDDKLIAMGDRVEDIAPKVEAARKEAGGKIGDLLDAADKQGITGPSVADIQKRVADDVLPDLQKLKNTNAGTVAKVQGIMSDLQEFARGASPLPAAEGAAEELHLTFRQAQDFRARVDDIIKWTTNPLAPVNETTAALKGVRNAIESSIVEAGDKAAPEIGGTWRTSYEEAKLRYRRLLVADKAAADTVDRFSANASHSLTDKLMGSQGLNIGMLHGLAQGTGVAGLASGGLHGLALGMLTGAASKLARTRGNSTLAVLADRLSALGGVERAVNAVDAQIERGVANAVSPGSRAGTKAKEPAFDMADKSARYRKRVEAVAEAAGSPDEHANKIGDAVAGLAPHAPQTSNAFQRAAIRATSFLASKLPQQPPHNPLDPHEKMPRVSDAQRAEYDRLVDTVHDPVGHTFGQIEKGTLTASEVDALRTVHPAIYTQMVQQTHHELAKATRPIPFGKRMSLATLLGVPAIDPSLQVTLQMGTSGNDSAHGHPAPAPHGAPKRMLKGFGSRSALTGSKALG